MLSTTVRGWIAALACAALVVASAPAPPALAASTELETAQELYDQSKYGEALERLREALDTGKVTGGEVVRARELMARCQVKNGDRPGAETTFLGLLRQDPLYQPDADRIPPDEMEAYASARRVFDAEQERNRQRIPACVGFFAGVGSGGNEDFGAFVASGGGDDRYDNKPAFGGFVRFPVRPRFSVQIELQRFRATDADSVTSEARRTYEITAIPLSVGLHWLAVQRPRWRAGVFAGGGPMLQTKSSLEFSFGSGLRISASDSRVGAYLHAGLEGELLLLRRLSLDARLFGRYAKASGLSIFESDNFDYTPSVPIANRDVDFSGFGAQVGLRTSIGD